MIDRCIATSVRAALITLAIVATACKQVEPGGQVIAVVDGVDLTVAELKQEARARNLPIGQDRALRNALIQELVDRKLLVLDATDRKLHRSPEHVLEARRLSEIALAQRLLATLARSDDLSDEKLAQFITANPQAFERRMLMSVDQISIPAIANPKLKRALAAAESVDRMEQILAEAGIVGSRSTETWDSASLPAELRRLAVESRPKATFMLQEGDRLKVGQVLSVLPQPVAKEQRMSVARQMIIRQRTEQVLEQILERKRSTARITYQPGFAPENRTP